MSLQYLNSTTMRIGPIPTVNLSYDAAWLYCACLTEDGYSDWRMPTISETHYSATLHNWYNELVNIGGRRRVTPVRDC